MPPGTGGDRGDTQYDGPVLSEPRDAPEGHRSPVVPLRVPDTNAGRPDSERLSDVDEWGRSEHMRSLVRTLYDLSLIHI